MPKWTPDPSLYTPPRMADGSARREVRVHGDARSKPAEARRDVRCGVDPGLGTYGQILGAADMPNTGDELHRFGWNACCSCLCPCPPHPHVERRYGTLRRVLESLRRFGDRD